MARGEGIYFWDTEGRRYTDMSSQLVNMNLGFGNKAIGDAIKAQVDAFCFVSPSYGAEPRAKLAEKIISLMPDNMGKVFFTNAGADANENAVKIARMFTGRNKVFSRYRSYHGSSFGAGNLTGEPRRYALEPGMPGFVKFFDPYIYREAIRFESEEAATAYYLAKLEEQIVCENPSAIAAIVLETITGSNGVLIPPKGYLPGVRALCDKYGILLIVDEVHDRLVPHREDVRLRALRRQARHGDLRQGRHLRLRAAGRRGGVQGNRGPTSTTTCSPAASPIPATRWPAPPASPAWTTTPRRTSRRTLTG